MHGRVSSTTCELSKLETQGARMSSYVSAGTVAYLLGSLPFGLIIVLVFRGVDVRRTGSGNIGATNVARVAPALGLLTLVLDAAKGYLAVFIAKLIASNTSPGPNSSQLTHVHFIVGMSALFAILGHMFSVWLKFKGGKGVATAMGVFLALMPKVVLLAIAVFCLVFALSRYVSLASISSAIVFPVLAYAVSREQSSALLPYICIACLLTVLKHHQNIRRLLSGTEPRLSFRH